MGGIYGWDLCNTQFPTIALLFMCVCMRGSDMSNDVNKTFSSNFEPSKLFYIKNPFMT